jgi:hypothetical protein
MKTIIKMLFVALLIIGTTFIAHGRSLQAPVDQKPDKYEVTTQLVEEKGTYEQRKLYREFLTEYMKNCPYISNFSIHEEIDSHNDHDVVWTYDINNWDDITKFYSWVTNQLKSSKNDGLKTAMTPYAPDYAIGGRIQVEKRDKAALAKY